MAEVPVAPVPAWSVTVIEASAPDWVNVTAWLASTPAVNAVDIMQPALQIWFEVRSTVPVKPVTVWPVASSAVTFTANGEPAICVVIAPPPTAWTTKWSRAPEASVMLAVVLVEDQERQTAVTA
jgi:hypothetical protein